MFVFHFVSHVVGWEIIDLQRMDATKISVLDSFLTTTVLPLHLRWLIAHTFKFSLSFARTDQTECNPMQLDATRIIFTYRSRPPK